VAGAALDHGLLSIDLVRPVIEPKVRTIEIATARPEAEGGQPQPIPTHRHAEGGPEAQQATEIYFLTNASEEKLDGLPS
jgi:hypothetical protein